MQSIGPLRFQLNTKCTQLILQNRTPKDILLTQLSNLRSFFVLIHHLQGIDLGGQPLHSTTSGTLDIVTNSLLLPFHNECDVVIEHTNTIDPLRIGHGDLQTSLPKVPLRNRHYNLKHLGVKHPKHLLICEPSALVRGKEILMLLVKCLTNII